MLWVQETPRGWVVLSQCTLYLWLGDQRSAQCTCGLAITGTHTALVAWRSENAHCTCGMAITGTHTALGAWQSQECTQKEHTLYLWLGDHRNAHCTCGLAIRETHTALVAWRSEECTLYLWLGDRRSMNTYMHVCTVTK